MIRDSYIYWPSFAKINLLSLWPSHLDIQCNGHWKYGMFDHYEFSSYSVLVLEKSAPPCFPSVNNQMPELSQRGNFFVLFRRCIELENPPGLSGIPKYLNKANPKLNNLPLSNKLTQQPFE